MATSTVSSRHSRRNRNKNARLSNAIAGVMFLVTFIFCLISFCSFLLKQLEVTNHSVYSNGTFGNCILYADWEEGHNPNVYLGRSGLCAFVIYGQLIVMIYTLVLFFVLFFKSIIGCALMRCDLIVELILNIIAMIFQFLTGIALSSGFKDTCDAVISSSNSSISCSSASLPPEGGFSFFGSVFVSVVFLWLSVLMLVAIIVYYMLAVIMCVRHRVMKSRQGDSVLMVDKDDDDNQMYALESESELRESVH